MVIYKILTENDDYIEINYNGEKMNLETQLMDGDSLTLELNRDEVLELISCCQKLIDLSPLK